MKPPFDSAEEDEDNNNTTTFHSSHTQNEDSKPEIISCDSPSNLSARSRRSRSGDSIRHGSRSRSSSPELEVDSPPPPRIIDSPVTEIHEISKKSNAFSVSALLRNDSDLSSKNSARKSPSISFTPLRYRFLL